MCVLWQNSPKSAGSWLGEICRWSAGSSSGRKIRRLKWRHPESSIFQLNDTDEVLSDIPQSTIGPLGNIINMAQTKIAFHVWGDKIFLSEFINTLRSVANNVQGIHLAYPYKRGATSPTIPFSGQMDASPQSSTRRRTYQSYPLDIMDTVEEIKIDSCLLTT